MNFPVPTDINQIDAADMPVEVIEITAGFGFRSIFLERAGILVKQHAHDHDHATYVGNGAARCWVDDVWRGDYYAGHTVEIKAGCRHLFMSLEPDTRLACVRRADDPEATRPYIEGA